MASTHPGTYRGPCRRGIFALSSWKVPLKRPQCLLEAKTEIREWKPNQSLMLKYKYVGNVKSPLGKELSVVQKEVVEFISRHNEHWICVRNQAGDLGFIPDSYVMVNPEGVKSLPWLDSSGEQRQVKQESTQFKPYKSAYAPKTNECSVGENLSQYYCKVCEKQLNGPVPYQVHLNSKSHKEEVENQSSY